MQKFYFILYKENTNKIIPLKNDKLKSANNKNSNELSCTNLNNINININIDIKKGTAVIINKILSIFFLFIKPLMSGYII